MHFGVLLGPLIKTMQCLFDWAALNTPSFCLPLRLLVLHPWRGLIHRSRDVRHGYRQERTATLRLMKQFLDNIMSVICQAETRQQSGSGLRVCVRLCVAMNKVGPWWKSIGAAVQRGQRQHDRSNCVKCVHSSHCEGWSRQRRHFYYYTRHTILYANTGSYKLILYERH